MNKGCPYSAECGYTDCICITCAHALGENCSEPINWAEEGACGEARECPEYEDIRPKAANHISFKEEML